MDRSNSIGNDGIQLMKVFAKNFVESFSIGNPLGAEFSVTQFNTYVNGLLDFSYDKTEIFNAIDSIGNSNGWTNTAQAIKFITNNYLPNSRSNVSVFVVLITDGEPILGYSGTKKKFFQKNYTINETNRMKSLFPNVRVVSH